MSYLVDRLFIASRLSPYLKLLTQVDTDLYNFRCPICGDSKKNLYKKRGYLYSESGKFFAKCHNCGYSNSLSKFIKELDQNLYQEYLFEKFGKKVRHVTTQTSEHVFGKREIKTGIMLELNEVPSTNYVHRYVNDRKVPEHQKSLLKYIDNFSHLKEIFVDYKDKELPDDERLLLSFNKRDGSLFAVQGRALVKNAKLRYVTLRLDEDHPLIYGLDRCNFNETIFCVEGPIDSLFLPNCIAVAGSDFGKLKHYIPKEQAIIILDNEPRNLEIIKKYKKIIDEGYKIVIWPDKIHHKDINDFVLAGYSQQQILDIIHNNVYSNKLKARLRLLSWKKTF